MGGQGFAASLTRAFGDNDGLETILFKEPVTITLTLLKYTGPL
jgi:hypothetical protein